MKNLLIATCICMVAVTGSACAQQVNKSLAWNNVNTQGTYLNDIHTRVARDFTERFAAATDAKWYKVHDGFIVKFMEDDIKHKAAYDNKKQWVYTIKYYDESKLLRDVRAVVKRVYYDYSITQVEEIKYLNNPIVYVVHMQDEKTWINVRVCAGEMEVLEEFQKK